MVAGKTMRMAGGEERTVTGVYKDFPKNCNFTNAVYMSLGDENKDNGTNFNYTAYIRTKSNANAGEMDATLKKILSDVWTEYGVSSNDIKEYLGRIRFSALPLDKTFMDGHDPETDRGNRTVYCILQLAVVLLLLVALINFANFSMSQAPVRLRSINTRKVMGESNLRLRLQLMGEGVVVCLCALVLSLLCAACIGRWEYIGEYTFGSIAVSDHPDIVLLLTVVSIVVGICATVYSAHYATSFQPAMVMKGNYGLNPGGRRLRRLLVGLQLVVAFVMVIFVGIVYCQRIYIYHSDYGYDKDNVLTADLTALPQEQYAALRSELEKVNGVESASFSFEILGANDTHMKWARNNNGAPYQFVAWPVDWKFLRTMGIGIIEGRDFKETDGDVCIINEAFKRKCPDIIELGKPLDGGELPILGVCRNFRASTVRTDCNTEPLAFIIFGERNAGWGNQTRILYVRTAPHADRKTMRTEVSRTLETFYDGQATTPEVKCYDDILEQTYKDEMRFMAQTAVSTLLAFLITIIGVFCLTLFETEYRRKEIAIRRVMGSSVSEVLSLFAMRYAVPLIIAFLIAAPIGYGISRQWLQQFAAHAPIHWWIFPLAFGIVGTVVLLTVIVQCWRVATTNLVESIRTE